MSIAGSDDSEYTIKDDVRKESACIKLGQNDLKNNNLKCVLCKTSVYDPILYGDLYQLGEVITHYFCLLFACNLVQNGEDHEGILGFFVKDIKSEVRRGSRLRCVYCRKNGATVGCFLKSCRKTFHLPCGLDHGTMHQYYDAFSSFCSSHRPKQQVDEAYIKAAEENEDGLICPICYDTVSNKVSNDTLWAPCCKKRFYHRICIARQAVAQGYFFKCPMCNNEKEFSAEMKKFGIYIPEMDAAWEREPNAFQDLLQRYQNCDAVLCKCPEGRTFSPNTGSWRMLRCNTCGSQGTHIACSSLKIAAASYSWRCPGCVDVTSKAGERQGSRATKYGDSIIASTMSTLGQQSFNSNFTRRRPSSPNRDSPTIKRVKSSTLNAEIDVISVDSCSSVEDEKPGPSSISLFDEDEIIVVDDTDSDTEVNKITPTPLQLPRQEDNSRNVSQEPPKHYELRDFYEESKHNPASGCLLSSSPNSRETVSSPSIFEDLSEHPVEKSSMVPSSELSNKEGLNSLSTEKTASISSSSPEIKIENMQQQPCLQSSPVTIDVQTVTQSIATTDMSPLVQWAQAVQSQVKNQEPPVLIILD